MGSDPIAPSGDSLVQCGVCNIFNTIRRAEVADAIYVEVGT
jgi:hypothetical protein